MNIDFNGKTIVVTGAGQGIGRGICERLYNFGATVYAISRSPGPLDELKAVCPNTFTICLDLANWKDTHKLLQSQLPKHIDGLVNNAGIAIIKPFLELTETDFDDTFNVNVKGVFNVSQIVVPKMWSSGSIVNISSLAGLNAFQNHSIYSATKAAVDALTKSMALEFGKQNIRVNSINPTVIMTNMSIPNWSDPAKAVPLLDRIPLHRFGEVDEVVDATVFLLSDKSSYINGHCLPLEGGYSA